MSEIEIEIIARGVGTDVVKMILTEMLDFLRSGRVLESETLSERVKERVTTILSRYDITEKPN